MTRTVSQSKKQAFAVSTVKKPTTPNLSRMLSQTFNLSTADPSCCDLGEPTSLSALTQDSIGHKVRSSIDTAASIKPQDSDPNHHRCNYCSTAAMHNTTSSSSSTDMPRPRQVQINAKNARTFRASTMMLNKEFENGNGDPSSKSLLNIRDHRRAHIALCRVVSALSCPVVGRG